MKRIVGIILTLVLLVTTVYAEVTMTEAGEIAKTKLEISSEYEDFTAEVWEDDTYNFMWEKEDGYISVTVSKDGDILSYRKSEDKPYENTASLYKFTDEEIEKKATDFIKKIYDKRWQEFVFEKIEAHPFSDDVWVSFKRFKDGIPFCDNYISVYIDKKSGEVNSMETALTKGEPEKTDKVLTEEEAREIFAKTGSFRLEHVFGERGEYSTVVYKPIKVNRYIDAVTGEEVELYYEARPLYTANSSAEESLLMKDEMTGGLTEAELQEINKVEGLMSKADAEKIMKNMKDTDLKNYEVVSSRINTYSLEGVKRYELYINLRTKDKKNYGSIRFDAETKELLAFNTYSDDADEKVKYTDKNRSIAENFIKENYKDSAKLEDITVIEDDAIGYTPYTYCVKELGALYTGRGVNLQIDKKGIIRSYYVTDRNEGDKFSDASRVFPMEDAIKVYYENIDFELKYIQVFDEKREAKIVLAYVVTDEPSFIEGISLKPLEHNLDDYKKEEAEPDYIGHYAEEQINSLVKNGVLHIENGKFEPDKALTWEKAVEILNSATPKYVEVPKDKENEEINRLDAVKILIDSLGHKEVAELNGIYKTAFSDMTGNAYEGYTALAKGLGIVSGDGKGNFNPYNKTTNADFAIMVYNYLKK